MKIRDVFRLAIRLFALLALVNTLFQALPQLIQYSIIDFRDVSFVLIMILLIVIALLLLFFRFLFIDSDKLIDWLRLDKNFEQEAIILGESSFLTLVKLALVIFGVYLLVLHLPNMFSDLYSWFRSRINPTSNFGIPFETDYFDLYYYISNLLIAGILIIYHDFIAKKIVSIGDKE